MDPNILKLWAKISDNSADRYPLLFHMLDTAAVCEEIWGKCLQKSSQEFMTKELAMSSESEARQWVSYLAGLHDIGKASPGFQSKSIAARQELEKLGFDFQDVTDIPHGIVSACVLPDLLQNKFSTALAKKLAVVVGGHHGVFSNSGALNECRRHLGKKEWQTVRQALYDNLGELCGIKDLPAVTGEPGNAFYMFLAGLVSVADWIASNETYFPYKTDLTVDGHLDYSKGQALKALDNLGWTGWKPALTEANVQELFPFIKDVRPLQQEAITLANAIGDQPGLVIIEAPMGEGKTEAAIYLADNWVKCLGQKGYYFALPTMATSNQMFGRVENYLKIRYPYPDNRVNFMLLHGHAALSAEFKTLQDKFETQNVSGDRGYDKASAGVVASEWFTHRKRGLLAPFGVGTIDQALLAVLQTRHVFVRLFGLAHKTIIIDEVHAYDAYMTTLMERLLEWLAALGSSVVLLSATLPKGRRDTLLEAYAKGIRKEERKVPPELDEIRYPRISWTDGSEFHAKRIDTSPDSTKKLQIQKVNGDLPVNGGEYLLGKQLKEALAGGGCAAVICNTVDQAQKVYQALKPYFPSEDAGDGSPELDLLHARYLYGDRKKREERTLLRFGKPGAKVLCSDGIKSEVYRPKRAILVATQIIEQSLDLDFDLMVTEMVPVDLLLQRAGRTHRHKRDNRSANFTAKPPELWICQPKDINGVLDFGGGTQAVYDYHILLRSWLEIKDKTVIKIPGDVESLIEAVYDKRRECLTWLSAALKMKWEDSKEKLEHDKATYEIKAKGNRILPPGMDTDDMLEAFNKSLEEDNPEIHASLQALTRISEGPSVSAICLNGSLESPYLLKDALKFSACPTVELTRHLLERSVTISTKGLVHEIISEDNLVPKEWRKQSLLRHHYILFFDESGECPIANWNLRLHGELGLVFQKKEAKDNGEL